MEKITIESLVAKFTIFLILCCIFFQVKQADAEVKEKISPQKRHRPITFDNGDESEKKSPEKRSRSSERNQKMYAPPSGKYSSRINNYSGRFSGPSQGGRGRGSYGRKEFRGNGAPFRKHSNY